MSKLPQENKFIDLSDYGRPIAKLIAQALKHTQVTPIHVTMSFIVAGLLAIWCLIEDWLWLAAFFLIVKSILDAADGELARVKDTPSYTGRYFDSVADIILNLLILLTLWRLTQSSLALTIIAFLGIQLQGTLYNYYYVILRNSHDGDTTSRVYENKTPTAFPGESQRSVNIFFGLYNFLYRGFDKAIYLLDSSASRAQSFPNWFMTMVSIFGLGFQLLIISVMLVAGAKSLVIPFFALYSLLILVFVFIRKYLIRE